MASKTPNPFAIWQAGMAFWVMMAEAQTVMALRLAAMAGLLPARAGEDRRMVMEKGPAFARSALAAGAAMARGARPEAVLDAAVKPLGRRTRANVERLLTPAKPTAKAAPKTAAKPAAKPARAATGATARSAPASTATAATPAARRRRKDA